MAINDNLPVYDFNVSNVSTTSSIDYWPSTTNFSYVYKYPLTVYKYQLICPRCSKTNWGEVDKVVTCSGKIKNRACTARLKAVIDRVDYEIDVK